MAVTVNFPADLLVFACMFKPDRICSSDLIRMLKASLESTNMASLFFGFSLVHIQRWEEAQLEVT